MKLFDIARVCHEANRAFCESLGDLSQPEWEDAPEWQRDSARRGVEFALANPDLGPEYQHEQWCRDKLADGWKYSPEKDAKAKLHPCLVSYDKLPPEQRMKDKLFRSIVGALDGR